MLELRSNSKSLGNHVVSSEKKKGCRGKDLQKKEGFKSGMKENVGDKKEKRSAQQVATALRRLPQ